VRYERVENERCFYKRVDESLFVRFSNRCAMVLLPRGLVGKLASVLFDWLALAARFLLERAQVLQTV
jgi:hypothetical protein